MGDVKVWRVREWKRKEGKHKHTNVDTNREKDEARQKR